MSTKQLDFIKTLFLAIKEDVSISDEVKPYLMGLKIPVIKISEDKEFYTEVTHPARMTLLLLTKICSTNVNLRQLSIDISKITDELIHQTEITKNSFIDVNKSLLALMGEFDKSDIIKSYEEKIHSKNKLIKKENIKQQVIIKLQEVIADNKIPMLAHELTLKIWPQLLYKIGISEGINSNSWKVAIDAFEQMIIFLQPVKNVRQWNHLYENRVSFIESIELLLNNTDIDKQKIDVNIEALRNAINTNVNKFKNDNKVLFEGLYSEDEVTNDAPGVTARLATEEAVSNGLPGYVQVGEWFDVYTGDNEAANRLKLSLIIEGEGKLIFVDNKGVKGMIKDIDVFAEELSILLSKPVKSTRPKFVDTWNEIKAKIPKFNK